MIRPTADEQLGLDQLLKQNVRYVAFLRRWRDTELLRLPKQQMNVALFQGRSQILQELLDALDPEAANQPTIT